MTMTTAELRAALGRLPPEQRRQVLLAAQLVRTARASGDTRPAAQIAAHVLARRPSAPAH